MPTFGYRLLLNWSCCDHELGNLVTRSLADDEEFSFRPDVGLEAGTDRGVASVQRAPVFRESDRSNLRVTPIFPMLGKNERSTLIGDSSFAITRRKQQANRRLKVRSVSSPWEELICEAQNELLVLNRFSVMFGLGACGAYALRR